MNLLTLFLLPTVLHPLPAIMPFYDVKQREQAEIKTWERAVDKLHSVEEVNDYWNGYTYHETPIWQTPEAVFESHSGDCKDFAIAKYYSLRYMGVAASRLKLTVVLTAHADWHMVLVVDDKVLDNRFKAIHKLVDINYEPAYSVNEDNLWTLGDVK